MKNLHGWPRASPFFYLKQWGKKKKKILQGHHWLICHIWNLHTNSYLRNFLLPYSLTTFFRLGKKNIGEMCTAMKFSHKSIMFENLSSNIQNPTSAWTDYCKAIETFPYYYQHGLLKVSPVIRIFLQQSMRVWILKLLAHEYMC